jgi:gas vesicle protein
MSENAIVLSGLKETLKALGDFDKDAVKAFNKVINRELSSVKKEAQGFVEAKPPLSGWATQPARNPRSRGGAGWPAWDQSIIKAGISTSKAEGKVRRDYTTSAGAIKNRSAQGVIYELAGRRSRGNGTFIKNLEGNVGDASRLVWKAVDNNRDKVQKNISDALEQAKRTLQQNLDKEKN